MSNDNNAIDTTEPAGTAAILLVESLIHALVNRNLLTCAEAVEIVEVALDIAKESAAEPMLARTAPLDPITILASIGASLTLDIDG